MARRVAHHDERTHLLVGTTKGVFVYDGDFEREKWKRITHQLVEHPVHSITFDYRDEKTIFVASGGGLHRSRDFGRTWDKVGKGLPSDDVTHVAIGHQSETDTLYAGLRPAGLARSEDGGETFTTVAGFADIDSRTEWWCKDGEPYVNSVVVHPTSADTLHVAATVAGVFTSIDGGRSFTSSNEGIEPTYPDGCQHRDVHRQVHCMVSNPAKPDRFYVAARGGLYRTEDGGKSWVKMDQDLDSGTSRSLAVSPSKPGTVFVVPLADRSQDPPVTDDELVVCRSTSGGEMWDRLDQGLEDQRGRVTIHREAMCVDDLDEEGTYFATSKGDVFASLDEGETWLHIARGLPPVLSLEMVAQIQE